MKELLKGKMENVKFFSIFTFTKLTLVMLKQNRIHWCPNVYLKYTLLKKYGFHSMSSSLSNGIRRDKRIMYQASV